MCLLCRYPPPIYKIVTSSSIGGEITPTQRIEEGQTVSVTATANVHYQFKEWTGDCGISSPNPSIDFKVSQDCSIRAIFEKRPYPVTATPTPGGSIDGLPFDKITQGQAVVLTALADENHVFTQWTTDASSGCPDIRDPENSKLYFFIQGPCALKAVFAKASRTITTEVNEGGYITPDTTVEHGQEVSIALTLDGGYAFEKWTGDCGDFSSDKTTVTFEVTKDCQIQAIVAKKAYTITLKEPQGGIIDGLEASGKVSQGETVHLSAQADENHVFVQWKISDEASACPTLDHPTDSKLSWVVEGPCTLEAVFMKAPHTITTEVNEGGRINPTPSITIEHGQKVSVEVAVDTGYTFEKWTGDCGDFSSDKPMVTFEATKDCHIGAVLEKKTYTITTEISAGGRIKPTPSTTVEHGQSISISIDIEEGYDLKEWTGDCGNFSSNKPTVTFEATKDCHIGAVLEKKTYTITTEISAGGRIKPTPSTTVEHGQSISISIDIEEGYDLKEWTGDCGNFSSNKPTVTFEATKDCHIGAVLEKKTYTITTEISAGGRIKPTPSTTVEHGQSISIRTLKKAMT